MACSVGQEGLQEEGLGIADNLQALVGEVAREAGQDQARAIDGRLANDALEPGGSGNQIEFEGAGVLVVEPLDSYGVTLHGGKGLVGVME